MTDVDAVAERWWENRLATPEQVADLFDEAFDARSAVLDARAEAGLAGCRLLSATGVSAAAWPRGPGQAQGGRVHRLDENNALGGPTRSAPLLPDGLASSPPR